RSRGGGYGADLKADERPVIAPVLGLEVGAVAATAAARQILNAAHEPIAGHAEAAAQLDVIAARKAQRLVVTPPRHVQMHAADAIGVVPRHVLQRRDESTDAGAGGIGEVL